MGAVVQRPTRASNNRPQMILLVYERVIVLTVSL